MLSLGASLVSFGIGNWTKKDQQGIRRKGANIGAKNSIQIRGHIYAAVWRKV